MLSTNKLKQTKEQLETALDAVQSIYASALPGEEFHPAYRKYPKIFRKLVSADMKTERELRKYFKEATARIDIDWVRYMASIKTASITDLIEADWNKERLLLKVILTESLANAVEAGGESFEEDSGVRVEWNSDSTEAIKFLRTHGMSLAKDLTDTTLDRVREALKTSLELGENQSAATARINAVINDPKRAAKIAHTEAVRAFGEGRRAVATEVGADRKRWSSTFNACPICQPLNGKVVALEKNFDTDIFAEPAHPNCRCIVRYLLPDEPDDEYDDDL